MQPDQFLAGAGHQAERILGPQVILRGHRKLTDILGRLNVSRPDTAFGQAAPMER
jgi:hypothetical protein